MSLLRQVIVLRRPCTLLLPAARSATLLVSHKCRSVPSYRAYASKGTKSTASLIPGSKQPITDPAAREEYAKADEKMKATVEWYRKDCVTAETRASGRITPAILDPVRVTLPGSEKQYRLDELATVGVRDGSTLLITVFDEYVRFKIHISATYSSERFVVGHISSPEPQ